MCLYQGPCAWSQLLFWPTNRHSVVGWPQIAKVSSILLALKRSKSYNTEKRSLSSDSRNWVQWIVMAQVTIKQIQKAVCNIRKAEESYWPVYNPLPATVLSSIAAGDSSIWDLFSLWGDMSQALINISLLSPLSLQYLIVQDIGSVPDIKSISCNMRARLKRNDN